VNRHFNPKLIALFTTIAMFALPITDALATSGGKAPSLHRR
jgi:hypothetical protein